MSERSFPPHASVAAVRARWSAAAAAAACIGLATAAEAYVGPGAGMGLLGVMLAVVAAIFMALVGMVLWPIRMVAHRRKARAESERRDERRDPHGAARPKAPPRG